MAEAKGEVTEVTAEDQLSIAELASLEKKEAKKLSVETHKWWLWAGVGLFVIALFLPHIRGVAGWQVLLMTETASDAGVRLAEYVFYILGTLGIVVLTLGTLLTRRTWMAWAGWILSCITLVYAVFAIWMRQTTTGTYITSVSFGMFAAALGAIATVWGLSSIILARTERQREVASLRAASRDTNAVAEAQEEILRRDQPSNPEENPLLIDDRRARASRRHKVSEESSEPQAEPAEDDPSDNSKEN